MDLIEDFLRHVDESLVTNPTAKNTKLDVGVISFYLAQTNELRDRVGSKDGNRWQHLDVQVNTVDQFQGRECSVIIVSLVRTGEVGGEFVKDYRRINVAFSRAKNLLVIVVAAVRSRQPCRSAGRRWGGKPKESIRKLQNLLPNVTASERRTCFQTRPTKASNSHSGPRTPNQTPADRKAKETR